MITDRVGDITSKVGSSKIDDAVTKYAGALIADATKQIGPAEAGAYCVCGLLVFVGYHMASDGVFSSIVTLASVIQLLGLVFTMMKIQTAGGFGMLSMKSLQLYVVVYVMRLACTLFNEGYLPIDCSGDWAYQGADILSLCVVIFLLCKARGNPTVKEEKPFPMVYCIAGCIVLAIIVHPCHNLGTWSDVSWTAAVYLETFVMLPQLRLIASQMSVEALTSHSIACTFGYRALNFYFWFICRRELVRTRCPTHIPAYVVVGALAIQTILLLDFMFYYLRAVVNRTDMMLPTFEV